MGKTVTAVHVSTYGTALEIDFDATRSPYDVAREFIGDYTEKVKVLQVGEHMLTMWVDEMGHLKELDRNAVASRFYPAPGRGTPGDPPILGDAIFLLMALVKTDEGMDWKAVELTQEAREALRRNGVGV